MAVDISGSWQKRGENLLKIWRKYSAEERAIIEYICPKSEWRTDVRYPHIKCLVFESVDRGIYCWDSFRDFLKRAFPNLQSLFLSQNYSFEREVPKIIKFLKDDWLEHIIICDQQTTGITCLNQFEGKMRLIMTAYCTCETTKEHLCAHSLFSFDWREFLYKIDYYREAHVKFTDADMMTMTSAD